MLNNTSSAIDETIPFTDWLSAVSASDAADLLRRLWPEKNLWLMEGAVGERLKQEYLLQPDPDIGPGIFCRTEKGRQALREIWTQYMRTAADHNLPLLLTAPTRRSNRDRLRKANMTSSVLRDNIALLHEIRRDFFKETPSAPAVFVGALLGCRGDAYTADGALSADEALCFHKWQADILKESGAEFLMAGIMPALPEAKGMALALAETDLPYIISFTLQPDGCLPDGTHLHEAITAVDQTVLQTGSYPPVCFMANCVHPDLVRQALEQPFNRTDTVSRRFLGIQANTSPLPYPQLEAAVRRSSSDPERLKENLLCSSPAELADSMLYLKENYSLKLFGGCCGTDDVYLREIAQILCGP